MHQFLVLAISGLVSGALYSIMATGLVLGYTTSGIFNLAQGAIAFSIAFTYLELRADFPVGVAAAISVFVVAPCLGLLLDRLVLRRLSAAPEMARIVGTIGIAIALPALLLFVLTEIDNFGHTILPGLGQGSTAASLGPAPPASWKIGPAPVNSDQVIILGAAAVTGLGLWWLVRRTRIGLEMRAAVDRRYLAELRGVDVGRSSRVAWVTSTTMAGVVGVVGGILLGLTTDPYTVLLFSAAAAAVIGRFRSIPLAFFGGLFLGLAQNLVAGYADTGFLANVQGLNSSVPFIVLLLGLVVMGRDRVRSAGIAATSGGAEYIAVRSGTWRSKVGWGVAGGAVLLFTFVLADNFWASIMAVGFIYATIYLSFVIVTGLGGMISLAQAAFVTLSPLFAGWFATSFGLPFLAAAAVAVVIGVLAGVVVALPALRLDGLSLALATLALAYLCADLVFLVPSVNNSTSGWTIPQPKIWFINTTHPRQFAVLAVLVVVVVTVLIRNFERSPSGRSVLAVRGTLVGARASGINPVWSKLVVFAFSAGVAGIGGILLAVYLGEIQTDTTPVLTGLLWVTIAITIGIRRPVGAIIAGLSTSIFPQLISYATKPTYIPTILFGLGAVQLAASPDGVLAQNARQFRALQAKWQHRRQRSTTPSGEVTAPVSDRPASEKVVASPPAGAAPISAGRPMAEGSENLALELRRVCAGYEGTEVLHEIDLRLAKGSITALLGANGAGKSTLCQIVGGLMDPTKGSVHFDGIPVRAKTAHDRANDGVYVAPEQRGIFPGLTVDENVSIWLMRDSEREALYGRFPQLKSRRKQLAGSLSGGEQQLLTLAPAFVRLPKVFVADELALGLAPLVMAEMVELLVQLKKQGVTVLFAEEKIRRDIAIADVVAVIDLGRIVWTGSYADMDAGQIAATYLGSERSAASNRRREQSADDDGVVLTKVSKSAAPHGTVEQG